MDVRAITTSTEPVKAWTPAQPRRTPPPTCAGATPRAQRDRPGSREAATVPSPRWTAPARFSASPRRPVQRSSVSTIRTSRSCSLQNVIACRTTSGQGGSRGISRAGGLTGIPRSTSPRSRLSRERVSPLLGQEQNALRAFAFSPRKIAAKGHGHERHQQRGLAYLRAAREQGQHKSVRGPSCHVHLAPPALLHQLCERREKGRAFLVEVTSNSVRVGTTERS